MTKFKEVLALADEKKMCVEWGCTTRGARDFKILIQEKFDHITLSKREATLTIANQLNLLDHVQGRDSVTFLIRIRVIKLREEELKAIWYDTPCGDLYQQMLDVEPIRDAV